VICSKPFPEGYIIFMKNTIDPIKGRPIFFNHDLHNLWHDIFEKRNFVNG
jgi:hypothetical protein